jgi:hypothetical protein
MCSLVLMMVDESSSLLGPVGDPFSFVLMSDEWSSLFRAVGCCSKAGWTVTSSRFCVLGVAFVCLVLANTRLLTWRF